MTRILFILDGSNFLFGENDADPVQMLSDIRNGVFALPFRSDPVKCVEIEGWVVVGLRSRQSMIGYLTQQEINVLELLIRGKTVNQIAVALTLSPETIKYHIEGAKIRMQVETRNELIALYCREKENIQNTPFPLELRKT